MADFIVHKNEYVSNLDVGPRLHKAAIGNQSILFIAFQNRSQPHPVAGELLFRDVCSRDRAAPAVIPVEGG